MSIPATQIYSFQALIPAGTPLAAPVTTDCSFPAASVVGIRWRVPPGPSGFMGFQVTSDGAPVIPLGVGNYIVADDESAQWDIAGYQDSGAWQVTGYNTDSWDHSVYVDFLTVAPGADQPPSTVNSAGTPPVADQAISPSPPDVTTFDAGVQVPT